MGYAVVGYFDTVSDAKIRALWKGLGDIGVDDYLINSENNPHFKFGMFNSMNLEYAQRELGLISKRINKIDILFKKYSFYPNDNPFLNLDIAYNAEIIELHRDIQDIFSSIEKADYREYFAPGWWNPDCQLTIPFDRRRLTTAVDYLSQTELPFNGRLERIGVIEFHPAKQLFEYALS